MDGGHCIHHPESGWGWWSFLDNTFSLSFNVCKLIVWSIQNPTWNSSVPSFILKRGGSILHRMHHMVTDSTDCAALRIRCTASHCRTSERLNFMCTWEAQCIKTPDDISSTLTRWIYWRCNGMGNLLLHIHQWSGNRKIYLTKIWNSCVKNQITHPCSSIEVTRSITAVSSRKFAHSTLESQSSEICPRILHGKGSAILCENFLLPWSIYIFPCNIFLVMEHSFINTIEWTEWKNNGAGFILARVLSCWTKLDLCMYACLKALPNTSNYHITLTAPSF